MNKLSELDSLIMEVLSDEPELLNEKFPFESIIVSSIDLPSFWNISYK